MVHEQNTELQKPKVCVCVFVCFLTLPIPTALASLEAQMVKNLHATQETWVQSLGQEDPLEKGTATHSSILAWRISRTQEPGGLRSTGSQRVGHNWVTLSLYDRGFTARRPGTSTRKQNHCSNHLDLNLAPDHLRFCRILRVTATYRKAQAIYWSEENIWGDV